MLVLSILFLYSGLYITFWPGNVGQISWIKEKPFNSSQCAAQQIAVFNGMLVIYCRCAEDAYSGTLCQFCSFLFVMFHPPQATGAKMANVVQFFSTVVSALAVSFIASWELTLLLLAVIPLVAAGATIQTNSISGFSAAKQPEQLAAGKVRLCYNKAMHSEFFNSRLCTLLFFVVY